ncbi:hypothetical protein [Roseovarius aquimarinus]|uniref:Uncharacterized protein n=1 Tax=Roseovarius aquimarinus TaxID=1229156 RepID=A0ABW7I4E3_9RHOB
MGAPRNRARIVAGSATAVLVVVAAIAVWRHQTGAGGDDPATRQAVMARIEGALEAAGTHSARCAEQLLAQTSDAPARPLDDLETCGETARLLAEEGYTALDEAAGMDARGGDGEGDGIIGSPARAAYLDASGALFSVYEIQGDDFDVIFDTLHRARLAQTPLAQLNADVSRSLSNSAPDVAAAQSQQADARETYRRGG